MASSFSLTQRSLKADRSRGPLIALAVALLLLGLWTVWIVGAEIAVYEVSESARLETALEPHRVESTAHGRIDKIAVSLGEVVEKGAPLVEIDAEKSKLELAEARKRQESLRDQLAAAGAEIAALERVVEGSDRVARLEGDEARAHHAEERARERLTGELATRSEKLRESGLIPGVENLRAQTEAERARKAAEALDLRIRKLREASATRRDEQLARLQELRRSVAGVEGDLAATEMIIARLERTIDEHVIRSPVTGRIDWLADLQVGSVVEDGQPVATVIPRGPLKVVARFPPSALGRLAPGQQARVRLDGFSWLEYGHLDAEVTTVSAETVDGWPRVELALGAANGAIPVQHGLPGRADVIVEHVSPAELILRSVGERLSP